MNPLSAFSSRLSARSASREPKAARTMSRPARSMVLLAVLLLGALYVTPIWSVRLVAPQYPEGIGMVIRLNTIEGMKEHDLKNINSLNHYIGMKAIEPAAIPELKYMPWIVAGLIASGLLLTALGSRRLLLGWVVAFGLLGAAGLYDFWRWSYDYGHNLDVENAIIVVPGMSYQPPLFGTKQLLNFTATSLPHVGGVLAGVAFAAAAAALFLSYRGRRNRAGVAGIALVAAACAGGTPVIAYGAAACVECRMLVIDSRFAAAVVTSSGKTLSFDSVDCLLEYLDANTQVGVGAVWVSDADSRTLIEAERAAFVVDGALRPPMGSVVAYAAPQVDGALTWAELRTRQPGVEHAR
jgi:copper chaperone NosL